MIIEKKMLTLILSISMLGCGPANRQESDVVDSADIRNLPRIKHENVSYPYTRYSESTNQTASRGRAFFLYPIKTAKTEILALEYAPGMRVLDLFGEELLGTGGKAYHANGQIGFAFLPISLPVGVVSGQKWSMRYARRQFLCEAQATRNILPVKNLSVTCISGKYSLSFEYSEQVGITEFEDFCDFSICTYKLMDSQGLLSASMIKFMGLPRI